MSSRGERFRWIGVPAIAAFGMLAAAAALYPGFLNDDSKWQLYQARLGVYNNTHPPVMAFVWRRLDWVLPGTGGLFLFHAALFWLGFGIFIVEIFPKKAHRAFAAAAAAAYVPWLATFGVVVKDGGFAYALMLCSACLLRAQRVRSPAWIAAAMAPLFYAVALRHDGLAAALPLTLWAGTIAASRRTAASPRARTRLIAAMIGGLLFLYAWLAVHVVDRALSKVEAHASQMVMTWDLTGISVRTGRNYLPRWFFWDGRPLSIDELKRVYDPESNWGVFWGPRDRPRPGFVHEDEDFAELRRAWLGAVMEQPVAYLSHRWAVFLRVLGIHANNGPYWLPPSGDVPGSGALNAPIRKRFVRLLEISGSLFIFKAWFYLLIAAVCLGWGARLRVRQPVFWALGASALMYEGSHFFVSAAADFRYSWWPMCAALLLCALLIARGIERGFRAP